jgi:transposase
MTSSHVEVITSVERRRRWPRAEQERLVALSLAPGASASEIARAAGLHVSQLFRWRKRLCERIAPDAPAFLPVTIDAAPEKLGAAAPAALRRKRRAPARLQSRIEIELASGDRVRLEGEVEGRLLRQVLDALRAR